MLSTLMLALLALKLSAATNVVLNGSFENGMTNWNLGSNTTVSNAIPAQSGVHTLRATNDPGNTTQVVPLKQNTDYSLSVWIESGSLEGGQISFDTNDRFDAQFGQFNINTQHDWTEYTGTFNSGTFDSVTLRIYSGNPLLGTVYFDNIQVREQGNFRNNTLNMPMTPPSDPQVNGYTWEAAFPGGNNVPDNWNVVTSMRSIPGETDRMFISVQTGEIYIVSGLVSGNYSRSLYMTIPVDVNNETGLLSFDFHPNFNNPGQPGYGDLYAHYVKNYDPGGQYRFAQYLSKFHTNNPSGNTMSAATEEVLIRQLDENETHNGGSLHFGPHDGYLYLSIGDQGGTNRVRQAINEGFFGAVLRIDVDRKAENLEPNTAVYNAIQINPNTGNAYYKVPADNPWAGPGNVTFNGQSYDSTQIHTEFWANGFRNPYRFSFYKADPADTHASRILLGDVGSGGSTAREEINDVIKGRNYGWQQSNPKEGYVGAVADFEPPILAMEREQGEFMSTCVTGGLVYTGDNADLSGLKNKYLFADYGNHDYIAMLDPYAASPKDTVVKLFDVTNTVAFGIDPSNGDVIFATRTGGADLRRIVPNTSGGSGEFPQTLTETGAFSDLLTLTPNTGILPFEPNLKFWSDHAKKTRWFSIPEADKFLTYSENDNWGFPSGSVYIKHFDLEMTRGDPASAKRIETRFLVKYSDTQVYGVSYKWNDSGTEANLVPSEGESINYTIQTAGGPIQQTWDIPNRNDCMTCHTDHGGQILGMNSRQLNGTGFTNSASGNQLEELKNAGYFSNAASIPAVETLAKHYRSDDNSVSLEERVNSYLDVNCAYCHKPGGDAFWDARAHITLDGIINSDPVYMDDRPDGNQYKVIKPGDPHYSVLLQRVEGADNFARMPPLGSNVVDEEAITLLTQWVYSLAGNQAPVFTSAPILNAYEDTAYSYTATASDPEGNPLTFSAVSTPGWLSFDSLTQVLSGTPPNGSSGTYSIELQVSDDEPLTASQNFDLTVSTPAPPPNLILNPSFEDGANDWTLSSTGLASVSTNEVQEESYSLMLSRSDVGQITPTRQNITVTQNTDYDVSLWVKNPGQTAGSLIFDFNDKPSPAEEVQFVINTGEANDWQQYTGVWNSGTETTATIRMFTSGTFSGTVYFDNLVMSEVVPDVFQNWKDINGVSDDFGDDDGDGVVNLLEFALGEDPNSVAVSDGRPAVVSNSGSNTIDFKFRRNEAAVLYQVERSDSLTGWGNAIDVTDAHGAVGEVVTVQVPVNEMVDGKMFLRLKVTY